MGGILSHETVAGFDVAVHRALTDPILLGGAPRAVAIANGTLSIGAQTGPVLNMAWSTWCRSDVNRSFFLCPATCRTRSRACDTLPRSCARRVLC
jgi:type IV secretory pathway TrbD component